MVENLRLFAGTTDGVWAVDGSHRIMFWNQAAEELLGYPAREAIGQLCHELLRGRDAEGRPVCKRVCAASEKMAQGGLAPAFSMQVHRRDGTWCWLDVRPIRMPQDLTAAKHVVLAHQIETQDRLTAGLRLYLLGHIAVQRPDGTWVDGPLWRRARVRALLAILALQAGRPVHRDVLLERLWPVHERRTALGNLNATVYQLRRSLEPDLARGPKSRYIQYEADCYRLAGDPPPWLDVEAFEGCIADARKERDASQAIAFYREASALYRGDFVADLDPDLLPAWMEREQLRQFYLTALEELGALLEKGGEAAAAEEVYLKALTHDSCRESAAVRLMRLALQRGDRAAAVAHYRRLEAAQLRLLQVRPSAEARRLYAEVRTEG